VPRAPVLPPSRAACAAAVAALLGAGGASADEFDDQARRADPVPTRAGLAAELWSAVGDCGRLAEPFDQRQCRVVQRARRANRAETRMLVAGDAAAVEVGAYDDKTRSLPLLVRPCIACREPVSVGGAEHYVVGQGRLAAAGDASTVAVLHDGAVVLPDPQAAEAFRTTVAPRLRVEFLVALPAGKVAWREGSTTGARVRVDGFRVYDPCTGVVVAAKPAAAKLPPDSRACGTVAREPVADASLPVQHNAFAINNAMAPARAAARVCFQTHGEAGTAKLTVTVNAQGAVAAVDVAGELAGSPTDACLVKAVRAIRFPPMQRETMTFRYPVDLR